MSLHYSRRDNMYTVCNAYAQCIMSVYMFNPEYQVLKLVFHTWLVHSCPNKWIPAIFGRETLTRTIPMRRYDTSNHRLPWPIINLWLEKLVNLHGSILRMCDMTLLLAIDSTHVFTYIINSTKVLLPHMDFLFLLYVTVWGIWCQGTFTHIASHPF